MTRKDDYFEIEVTVAGHNKMRELILATCRAEASTRPKPNTSTSMLW